MTLFPKVIASLAAIAILMALIIWACAKALEKFLELADPWDDEDDDRCGIEHHFAVDGTDRVAVCSLEAGHGTGTHYDEEWGYFWLSDERVSPSEQRAV